MVRNNNKTLKNIYQKNSTYRKRISIFFMCLFIFVGILIYTGISLFSNKEDITKFKELAYIYDGEKHDAPPEKDRYEIEVVNCDKAVGTWSNKDWNITLTDIEGKTTCILEFKKRLSIYKLEIDPQGGTYKESTGITSIDIKETTIYQLEVPTRRGYTFAGWEVDNESSKVNGNTFTMGKENTKVTAKWNINSYEVEIS